LAGTYVTSGWGLPRRAAPPSAQGIRAFVVLAVVVWRLFHAAGRTRPMRRSAHRLALTGVDSQITEALLQAFSASELYPTSDGFGRIPCRSRVGDQRCSPW
jgi:hypothetical protein